MALQKRLGHITTRNGLQLKVRPRFTNIRGGFIRQIKTTEALGNKMFYTEVSQRYHNTTVTMIKMEIR
jgi:hypothetical protein